ncbi:MAG: TPR repeat-containing protein, partial [Chlorobi bacterium OLB5]
MKLKIILLLFLVFASYQSYANAYDSTRVSFEEAMDALDAEKYEEAVNLFTRYLYIATGHDEGYFQRGNAYYMLKQYDKALTDYSFAYNMGFKKDEIMFYRMGTIYKNNKDYLTAEEFFNQAVKLDSKYTEAYLELGNLALLAEDYKKAADNYNKALSLDPNFPEVYFALGEIYTKSGSYSEAVGNYEKAIKLDSTNKK